MSNAFMRLHRRSVTVIAWSFVCFISVNRLLLAVDADEIAATRSSLEAIRDESIQAAEITRIRRVKGRLFPGERSFQYTTDGVRWRFEVDNDQPGGRVACFRLDDGQTLFKLDENALSLDSREGLEKKHISLTSEISFYESPLCDGRQLDVVGWCNWLIGVLNNDPPDPDMAQAIKEGDVTITALREGSTTAVSLRSKFRSPGLMLSFRVDHSKRCSLVGWEMHDGADDPAQWTYDINIENEFAEPVAGVWMLSKGKMVIRDAGTAPRKSGRPELQELSIQVLSSEIGDFIVSDDVYSPESLPIKSGTIVHDFRVEPMETFIYGGLSIDTELINRPSDGDGLIAPASRLRGLSYLNVAMFTLLVAFVLYRKRAKR